MSVSSDSKRVLKDELDKLQLQKQQTKKLIDALNLQIADLVAQKQTIQGKIDAIQNDYNA